VTLKIFPRTLVVVCAAACLAAPAAVAQTATKYGPDLQVTGQGQGKFTTSSVALHVTLSPSYSTSKPGVVVTMRSCGGTLKLLRRSGGGGSLHASKGKLVWALAAVPGRPAKPKLNLILAAPKGRKTLCVSTSMYDSYTRKTVKLATVVPL
jgi:hypothetical protein